MYRSGRTYTCGPIKGDVPNLVTYLNQTPMFESYAVKYGSKNVYHKDMCLKVIGSRAQNLTILGSIVNIIVGTYMTINWNMRILTLLMHVIFI